MKLKVVLNAVEKETLMQVCLNHQYKEVRKRAMGLLMLCSGKKLGTVQVELDVSQMDQIQQWAKEGGCQLYYFDEAGFCGSPPVQTAWSPRGKPHEILPAPPRINVLGLLDFAEQRLYHQQVSGSVDRDTLVKFLDEFITGQKDNLLPRFLVLDNAAIHHNLNSSLIDKWMCQYNTFLCYLPTYSPELSLIEIVWKNAKYHWRDFMTWVKDELPEKVAGLLDGYENKFKIEFGRPLTYFILRLF